MDTTSLMSSFEELANSDYRIGVLEASSNTEILRVSETSGIINIKGLSCLEYITDLYTYFRLISYFKDFE